MKFHAEEGLDFIELSKRCNSYGEYVVRMGYYTVTGAKRYTKDAEYFTDDWADALRTFQLLMYQYKMQFVNKYVEVVSERNCIKQ